MEDFAKKTNLFTTRELIRVALLSVGYLLLSAILIGYKTEQVYLVLLFAVAYFSSAVSRKMIIGFSVFIVFWIIFDYMKAFPNYLYQGVHIESLYYTEKKLFGISLDGNIVTPNEYWLSKHNSFLDVLTGIFYLCWVPVPLAFAAYLFFKNRMAFLHFSLSFLLVNLIGFVIYYVYPAAPPWYVQQHGFDFLPFTPGNTGGLQRFDDFFNTHIFQGLYSKSSNVFAAMPSLHASYPMIVLYYGIKNKLGKINLLFVLVMIGIWFSAVYNSHHYVLDVLAGITTGIAGIGLFQWLIRKSQRVQAFLQMFVRAIT